WGISCALKNSASCFALRLPIAILLMTPETFQRSHVWSRNPDFYHGLLLCLKESRRVYGKQTKCNHFSERMFEMRVNDAI
ncbi:MAG TPA: hypothetical protein VGL82_11950, partial [Bryobacteraceae bacterium]